MLLENVRSMRSRPESSSPPISEEYTIEDDYVSKYTDHKSGVTHYIYSFDEGQSLVPSSASAKNRNEGDKDDEEHQPNQRDDLQDTTKPGSIEKLPLSTVTNGGNEERTVKQCGCSCDCAKDPNKIDGNTLLENFLCVLFVAFCFVGIFTMLMWVRWALAEYVLRATAATSAETAWNSEGSSGTYFGVCRADFGPCCFEAEGLMDNFQQVGFTQGAKMGFMKAVQCLKHLRSSK